MLSIIRIIDARSAMLPDDVFRDRLERTLVEIEAAVAKVRDFAAIDIAANPAYWRLEVVPVEAGACPFELIISADQTFSLKLANEAYEGLPIERLEFFPHLVHAVEQGHVERISKHSTLTDALVAVAMRVTLAPDWHWQRERRIVPQTTSEEWRTQPYLPYRRRAATRDVTRERTPADA
jgi:hypothetical protein